METISKTAREQFLDDVTTTAIEGGIGYWSVCHKYEWDGKPEVTAVIQELDEWQNKAFGPLITVNRKLINKGIKTIMDGEAGISDRVIKEIAGANATNDGCDIDADAADVIVQAAVFGEIVYG